MSLLKKIIAYFATILLGGSLLYYVVCKIANKTNPYTVLVDKFIDFINRFFVWVGNHWLAILIVIAVAIILYFIYYFIKKDKEKNL